MSVAVRIETGQEIKDRMAENRVLMIVGLRRIWETALEQNGLKPEDYSQIPGFGRLLTEEELKVLTTRTG